jgi:hypothetical protein
MTMRAAEYHWIVADIETVGRDNVAPFIEEPKPHGGWTDKVKIAADLETKRAKRREQLGLDPNLNRIVSLGYQTEIMARPTVRICVTEDEERDALREFWTRRANREGPFRTFVGFNNGGFDSLVMVQRSRLLGLGTPPLDIRKFNNEDIRDLYRELAFPDVPHTSVMAETLENFCRLFGIDVPDDVDGSQIADLVAEGLWDHVAAHNEACVKRTVALARAIGAIHVVQHEEAEVI